jgi:hypothetical protein
MNLTMRQSTKMSIATLGQQLQSGLVALLSRPLANLDGGDYQRLFIGMDAFALTPRLAADVGFVNLKSTANVRVTFGCKSGAKATLFAAGRLAVVCPIIGYRQCQMDRHHVAACLAMPLSDPRNGLSFGFRHALMAGEAHSSALPAFRAGTRLYLLHCGPDFALIVSAEGVAALVIQAVAVLKVNHKEAAIDRLDFVNPLIHRIQTLQVYSLRVRSASLKARHLLMVAAVSAERYRTQ